MAQRHVEFRIPIHAAASPTVARAGVQGQSLLVLICEARFDSLRTRRIT